MTMTAQAEMPTTRRQRVEARESAILQAAREVFVEYGMEGARMAEIGRRAGVSEAAVYTYYRNKAALMDALLADFWEKLTVDARELVAGIDDPLEQLRSLAEFHLHRIIRDQRFLGLTGKLRHVFDDEPETLDKARAYVRVFDQIFRRCIDRGLFRTEVPVWQPRDVFFGTLEYSARTAALRDFTYPDGAVDNLISLFTCTYGQAEVAAPDEQVSLVERLEAAVARLEQLGAHPQA